MTLETSPRLGAWLVAASLVASCRKAAPAHDDAMPAPAPEAGRPPEGVEHPARCAAAADSLPLERPKDAELGRALVRGARISVPALVGTPAARAAVVFEVGDGPARTAPLGPVALDAFPPHLLERGGDVLAIFEAGASSGAHAPPAATALALARVTAPAEVLARLPRAGQDPASLDAIAAGEAGPIGAVAVWDEDAPGGDAGPRGSIKVGVVGSDLRVVVRVDTLPSPGEDAEMPRLLMREGGYWVFWIAMSSEHGRDASAELEVPGEDRRFRWLEVASLDEQARSVGASRHLTSPSGHVASFEAIASPGRADVFALVEDERTESAGGSLIHVTVPSSGPTRSTVVVPDGVARGSALHAAFRAGNRGFLVYSTTAEHEAMIPLDSDGNAAGSRSLEPDLDDAPILTTRLDEVSGSTTGRLLRLSGALGTELGWTSCRLDP